MFNLDDITTKNDNKDDNKNGHIEINHWTLRIRKNKLFTSFSSKRQQHN